MMSFKTRSYITTLLGQIFNGLDCAFTKSDVIVRVFTFAIRSSIPRFIPRKMNKNAVIFPHLFARLMFHRAFCGVADKICFRAFQAACATVLFLSAAKMLSKIHLPSSLPGSGSQLHSMVMVWRMVICFLPG